MIGETFSLTEETRRLKDEIAALRQTETRFMAENARLKCDISALSSREETVRLTSENQTLRAQIALLNEREAALNREAQSLKDLNAALKEKEAAVSRETRSLKGCIASLQEHETALGCENESLKGDIAAVMEKEVALARLTANLQEEVAEFRAQDSSDVSQLRQSHSELEADKRVLKTSLSDCFGSRTKSALSAPILGTRKRPSRVRSKLSARISRFDSGSFLQRNPPQSSLPRCARMSNSAMPLTQTKFVL
jgi:chromosome segregation ATPase